MAKFLTYDINQVVINSNLFPANSISFQLGANTVPVKDIYGNLLYYSPTSPIQGSVSINFFLTGVIPSYLRLENQNEIGNNIAFNQLAIPDCHLTNLSFSVRPFEPIPVKADFIFYHGIRALNTNPGISSLNQSFNSGLNILNGMSSYIITDNRSTYMQNPADFVVTDFDYQFSVERVPILRVGEYFPLRVAMKEINAEFNITTNNLDGVLDVRGNSAVFSAVLKDNTDPNVSDTINLTGIITNQSYEVSEDNFGFSKIKMTQALNKKRSTITIPMEVNNPNIVNPPTNNNNVDAKPPTSIINTEIEDSTKPNTTDINIGSGTSSPPAQIDNTEWYYISVVVQTTMLNAQNAGGCNEMKIGSQIPGPFSSYNVNGMKFKVINSSFEVEYKNANKYETNTGADIKNQWNYSAIGTILTLKVNEKFLTDFLYSDSYLNNVNEIFINYSNIACNPLFLYQPTSPQEQKYSSFFRSAFFNAYSDEYKGEKGKLNPYIHNISIVPPNYDGSLYAAYKDSK